MRLMEAAPYWHYVSVYAEGLTYTVTYGIGNMTGDSSYIKKKI